MHDADGFQELFRNASNVDALLAATLAMLRETPGIAGVHMDFEVFEAVDPAARDGFTAFVARVAAELESQLPGLELSVFTMAFDVDDAYNEGALGQIADYLVIQGYDYHSPGSANAGPVAAVEGWGELNWHTVIRRFDDFGVPRRKLVMAVPLYGYEWPVESDVAGSLTRGPGVTIPLQAPPDVEPDLPRARAQALLHGAERDEESGTPWYRYEAPDGWRQGWFEDGVSLRRKFDFVRREGLGGVALFPLAYGGDAIWGDLRAAFRGVR
jgi:spore germination protein YaaH